MPRNRLQIIIQTRNNSFGAFSLSARLTSSIVTHMCLANTHSSYRWFISPIHRSHCANAHVDCSSAALSVIRTSAHKKNAAWQKDDCFCAPFPRVFESRMFALLCIVGGISCFGAGLFDWHSHWLWIRKQTPDAILTRRYHWPQTISSYRDKVEKQ